MSATSTTARTSRSPTRRARSSGCSASAATSRHSGFRESGRQIPGFLKKAGFKDITLEKNGLTTIGLDQDERSALFQTYFSFIVEDLMTMASRHPDDEGVKADVEWYREVFDDLEEAFHGDDFFFQVGFMTFTARR